MKRRKFLQSAGGALIGPWPIRPAFSDAPAPLAGLGNGFGLAIHDYLPATLDVARDAGFTLIRTDLFWSGVEVQRRVYDWATYDRLMSDLAARDLRAQFVLGFNNPEVYGGRWMEGITMSFERNAYAAFCAAAAARYASADPIWEIYNEPNRDNFWEPRANPAEYMTLARQAIAAIRSAQPDAIIIAPALGHKMGEPVLDLGFLEACLADGLAPLVDAISIHPYVDPEMVGDTYAAVQVLLDRYPVTPPLAVLSTEWGFATNRFVNDDLQADVLVRMFLMNLSYGIALSIAYVAVDRTEAYVPEEERTYGIVQADYTPKAAFHQLADMNRQLRGLRFRARLPSDPADVVLAFEGEGRAMCAVWTTGEPREAIINGTAMMLTSRPVYVPG